MLADLPFLEHKLAEYFALAVGVVLAVKWIVLAQRLLAVVEMVIGL
jgi:hypothetical protein